MLQVLLVLCLGTVVLSEAVEQKWDRLVVGFQRWKRMPLNDSEAENAGWIKNGSCDDNNGYIGNRYMKEDHDKSTRLIFGNDGVLAGIQATISPTSAYPTQSSSLPWIKVKEDEAIVTAYFRNPHTICSKAKRSSNKKKSTFGHQLYIHSKAGKLIKIPTEENALKKKDSLWVKGKCFPGMGMHYWYNVSANVECKDIFPVFLLYDDTSGKLSSFGWSLPLDIKDPLWEHPPPIYFKYFFNSEDDIPKCLNDNVISTQHIYLRDPAKLKCAN